MKPSKPDQGFSVVAKLLIFLFGAFWVILSKGQAFRDFPANEKAKNEAIVLYLSGLVFWVVIFTILSLSE